MFDTRPALADMADQIRSCRSGEGLTLQQLALRSGVAASTIHKVESQQMVPTVSVLLKIAKGLGRRPEELIRDEAVATPPLDIVLHEHPTATKNGAGVSSAAFDQGEPHSQGTPLLRAAIWRINLSADHPLPKIELDSVQRAIVLVERGSFELQTGGRRVRMQAGDCIEIKGSQRIESVGPASDSAALTLIVTPPGDLEGDLGIPNAFRSTPH